MMPQQTLSDRPRHPPTIVQVMEPTEEKEQGDQHPGILVCSGLRSFLEVGLSVLKLGLPKDSDWEQRNPRGHYKAASQITYFPSATPAQGPCSSTRGHALLYHLQEGIDWTSSRGFLALTLYGSMISTTHTEVCCEQSVPYLT